MFLPLPRVYTYLYPCPCVFSPCILSVPSTQSHVFAGRDSTRECKSEGYSPPLCACYLKHQYAFLMKDQSIPSPLPTATPTPPYFCSYCYCLALLYTSFMKCASLPSARPPFLPQAPSLTHPLFLPQKIPPPRPPNVSPCMFLHRLFFREVHSAQCTVNSALCTHIFFRQLCS